MTNVFCHTARPRPCNAVTTEADLEMFTHNVNAKVMTFDSTQHVGYQPALFLFRLRHVTVVRAQRIDISLLLLLVDRAVRR